MLQSISDKDISKVIEVASLTTELDWRAAVPVMQVLRPALKVEDFISRREQLLADGYHLLGVREDRRVVSLAGYAISPHVAYGRQLFIHDMITLSEAQGRGYATRLISELIGIAKSSDCGRIFVHTRQAQSLYVRNGFSEYSSGMIKKING